MTDMLKRLMEAKQQIADVCGVPETMLIRKDTADRLAGSHLLGVRIVAFLAQIRCQFHRHTGDFTSHFLRADPSSCII